MPEVGDAIHVVGIIIPNLIIFGFEQPLGVLFNHPNKGYLPAKVIATGVVVLYNFFWQTVFGHFAAFPDNQSRR